MDRTTYLVFFLRDELTYPALHEARRAIWFMQRPFDQMFFVYLWNNMRDYCVFGFEYVALLT